MRKAGYHRSGCVGYSDGMRYRSVLGMGEIVADSYRPVPVLKRAIVHVGVTATGGPPSFDTLTRYCEALYGGFLNVVKLPKMFSVPPNGPSLKWTKKPGVVVE